MLKILSKKLRLVLFLWPVLFSVNIGSAICAEVSQEYQLKAAFLFNFARFISWPDWALPQGEEPINFCIIGENPFAGLLSNLESRQIDGHRVKVHYLDMSSDSQQCHLAFYSDSSESRFDEIDGRFSGEHTVNVSDIPGFIEDGGDIEFIKKRSRIFFIISNSNLKRKNLQPRASLLELAIDIR